jgi:exosortase A-associated hydrolase 2
MEAFFLEGDAGDLYAVYHGSGPPTEKAVLLFPPFAEELNKCRRMISLQARRFADRGMSALVVDLYGTGDSAGDFGEARWDIWQRDLARAVDYLAQRGHSNITFWCIRAGALLLSDWRKLSPVSPERILLWTPVINGSRVVDNFLRLKVVAEIDRSISVGGLRDELSDGSTLQVAGYELSRSMAACLDRADLRSALSAYVECPILWMDVYTKPRGTLQPAAARALAELVEDGHNIEGFSVVGPQFWSTVEVTVAPELLDATARMICV